MLLNSNMDRNTCHQPVAVASPMADYLWSSEKSGSIEMDEAALQRVDGSLGAIARAHFVEQ